MSRVGIEIAESAIVFHDLPPEGILGNIGDGTVLYGVPNISILSNTPDAIGASLWGAIQPEGQWYRLGEDFILAGAKIFTLSLDTVSNGIFPPDLPALYLMGCLWDGYTFSNTSSTRVVVDNTNPEISFGTTLVDGEVLASPRTIAITTTATDIQYVDFYARWYNEVLDTFETRLLANDADGSDGWAFQFNPWALPAGYGYQFEALAIDQTLDPDRAGFCVVSDLTVSWVNPEFCTPTPTNLSRVHEILAFNFSSGTETVDEIFVEVAKVPDSDLSHLDELTFEPLVATSEIPDLFASIASTMTDLLADPYSIYWLDTGTYYREQFLTIIEQTHSLVLEGDFSTVHTLLLSEIRLKLTGIAADGSSYDDPWVLLNPVYDLDNYIPQLLETLIQETSTLASGSADPTVLQAFNYDWEDLVEHVQSLESFPLAAWKIRGKFSYPQTTHALFGDVVEKVRVGDVAGAYDVFLHDIKPRYTGLATDENEQAIDPAGTGIADEMWALAPATEGTIFWLNRLLR